MPAARGRRPAARDGPRAPRVAVMRLAGRVSLRRWRARCRYWRGRSSCGELAACLPPLSWQRTGVGRAVAAHPPRCAGGGNGAARRGRRPGVGGELVRVDH